MSLSRLINKVYHFNNIHFIKLTMITTMMLLFLTLCVSIDLLYHVVPSALNIISLCHYGCVVLAYTDEYDLQLKR
jgi:hypothetical protein